ncbi:MAG: ABC transporter permease [Candidatus Hodarchaeota archaeon]
MNTTSSEPLDNLNVIWTIASKDILDAIRNKLVLSLILGLTFMLSMPRVMSWMLDPPYTEVLVYDPGNSSLVLELENSPQFRVSQTRSLEELKKTIGGMGFGLGVEVGVVVPTDFDQLISADGQPKLDGYVSWANRTKADEFQAEFERQFTDLLGQPVHLNFEGNIAYPSRDTALLLGIAIITSVTLILIFSIQLVPNLLFEEKQTKTMEALLVSPATIRQVVVGKALAGLFYILVIAGVVFAFYYSAVVHWHVALLAMIGCGAFGVAVGLVLGSFFERQQEVIGLMMLLILILVGAMFVYMVNVQVPSFIQAIIPWVPSVTLAKIIFASFLEHVLWTEILRDLGSVLAISALLYVVVIWKVRRSDR